MNQMFKFLFKLYIISALLILGTGCVRAQKLNLIPYPSQVEVLKGNCVLNNSRLFTNKRELSGLIQYFNEEMGRKQKKVKSQNRLLA